MEQHSVRNRVIFLHILLFGIVIVTAYLQSVYQFNTYLALFICLAATVMCAWLLFN